MPVTLAVRSAPIITKGQLARAPSPTASCVIEKIRSGPVSRVLSKGGMEAARGAIIYLGCRLPGTSSNLPGSRFRAGQARGPRVAAWPCSLFGLAPRGVCLARLVTQPAGELLPHRFTLTDSGPRVSGWLASSRCANRPLPTPLCLAVYFLLHFPGPCGRWGLPTTVSYGARTFLPQSRRVRAASDHPAHCEP